MEVYKKRQIFLKRADNIPVDLDDPSDSIIFHDSSKHTEGCFQGGDEVRGTHHTRVSSKPDIEDGKLKLWHPKGYVKRVKKDTKKTSKPLGKMSRNIGKLLKDNNDTTQTSFLDTDPSLDNSKSMFMTEVFGATGTNNPLEKITDSFLEDTMDNRRKIREAAD